MTAEPSNPLSRQSALNCRPVKNREVGEHRTADGCWRLSCPVYPRPWIASLKRRLTGRPASAVMRHIELDPPGSRVWELLDGRRRVIDVIRAFQALYPMEEREAALAVTQFLRTLGTRGLIAMKPE